MKKKWLFYPLGLFAFHTHKKVGYTFQSAEKLLSQENNE